MAKDCGPSIEAEKLTAGIESAKAEADSLISSATEGIGGAISGLADKIAGLTDGIKGDLESMVPEIPQPELKMQDAMTDLLSSVNDPGAMITKYTEMQDKFGKSIDLSNMLTSFGMDSEELNKMADDYKGKLAEGEKIKDKLDKDSLADKLAGGIGKAADSLNSVKDSKLLALATGDISVIGDVIGSASEKLFGDKDATTLLDEVCTKIPNLELEADGTVVEKGPESKEPTEDCKSDEAKVDPKEDLKPEIKDTSKQNADALVIQQEKEDCTTFEFGSVQTNDTLTAEKDPESDYEKDLKRLAKWQEKARAYVDRAVRDKEMLYDELNGYGTRVPPLSRAVFENTTWRNKGHIVRGYVDALSEFSRIYMIQIARKYGAPGENDNTDQEFTIGTMTYKQPKPKKGEKYFYPREQYERFFTPNLLVSENTEEMRAEIDTFDMIEVSSETDFFDEEHIGVLQRNI